jgi:hypothetical protein
LSFHNSSSFCLNIYFVNVNGKAIVWHTPRFFPPFSKKKE